jgi:hypothetical protein
MKTLNQHFSHTRVLNDKIRTEQISFEQETCYKHYYEREQRIYSETKEVQYPWLVPYATLNKKTSKLPSCAHLIDKRQYNSVIPIPSTKLSFDGISLNNANAK